MWTHTLKHKYIRKGGSGPLFDANKRLPRIYQKNNLTRLVISIGAHRGVSTFIILVLLRRLVTLPPFHQPQSSTRNRIVTKHLPRVLLSFCFGFVAHCCRRFALFSWLTECSAYCWPVKLAKFAPRHTESSA
jgi:hypothetical protein